MGDVFIILMFLVIYVIFIVVRTSHDEDVKSGKTRANDADQKSVNTAVVTFVILLGAFVYIGGCAGCGSL